MRLILIRHGETEANSKEVYEGSTGGKLTEKGKAQARKVALRLRDEKVDVIYVSDLKRAVDTAKEIIKYHPNAEVIHDPRIREQKEGVLEGTPYGTLTREAEKRGLPRQEFRPEGGESINDMQLRVENFLKDVIRKETRENLLLVTHGGVIVGVLLYLLNIPREEYKKLMHDNTAVSIIELDFKDRHKLITLNCIKHLL